MNATNKHSGQVGVRPQTFGVTVLIGLTVLGALLWLLDGWKAPDRTISVWAGSLRQWIALSFWSLGAIVAAICLASPTLGQKVQNGWMAVGIRIGTVVSTILLTAVYFLVLPVFSLIRLKDPLRKKLKAPGESYWEDYPQHEPTIERTLRQF